MSLIETTDLWKTYVVGSEEIHALRGVDVNIRPGHRDLSRAREPSMD